MKPKGPALAIVFGSGRPDKGKSKSYSSDDGEGDMGDEYDSGDDQSASEAQDNFEKYIVQAFPDLEDDPDKIDAFWKAVRACVKA